MNWRNELMDAGAMYHTFAGDGRDRYYEYLLNEAKAKKKKQDDIDRKAKEDMEKRKREAAGQGAVPQISTTATPGAPTIATPTPGQQAINPAATPYGGSFGDEIATGGLMRRGGKVRRFADGGPVKPEDEKVRPRRIPEGPRDPELQFDKGRTGPLPSGYGVTPVDSPRYSGGYAVPRYEDGGLATQAEQEAADKSEADLIVESLLRRDLASDREPAGGSDDATLSTGNARRPAPADSNDTGLGTPLRPHQQNQLEFEARTRVVPPAMPVGQEALDTRIPVPKESPARGWLNRPGPESEEAAGAREKMGDWTERMADRKRQRREAGQVTSGERARAFEPMTPQQLRESMERRAEAAKVRGEEGSLTDANAAAPPDIVYPQKLDAEGRLVGGEPEPERPAVAPSQNLPGRPQTPAGGPTAASAAQAPSRQSYPEFAPNDAAAAAVTARRSGAPSAYGPVPRSAPGDEGHPGGGGKPYPIVRPGQGKPQQQTGGGGGGTAGGGGGSGTTGPGSGNGAVAAPPTGAIRTEDPRTRTAAFDPGSERISPSGQTAARQFNQQGQLIVPTRQELQQMVATAAQGRMDANGGAPAIGDGAVSRQNARAAVRQVDPTGQLTEGQALLVFMHSKYRQLLAHGYTKEAAEMAWGLIQAANLEAASLGLQARDQIRAGDYAAGRQTLANAANWAPDGMVHKATPNGIATYDSNGRLVGQMPVDGKEALRLALGFADGSLIWSALQGAVQSRMPVDKDAEGRGLRNDLTRVQIETAKQRLQALRARGQGGGAQAQDLERFILTRGRMPQQASSGGGGGGEGNYVFENAANAGDAVQDNPNG